MAYRAINHRDIIQLNSTQQITVVSFKILIYVTNLGCGRGAAAPMCSEHKPSYVLNCRCKILNHPAPNCMHPFCQKHPPILPKMTPKIAFDLVISDKISNLKNIKRNIWKFFGSKGKFSFHRQDLTNFWQKCRHLGTLPK